jgi:hypothetical protein
VTNKANYPCIAIYAVCALLAVLISRIFLNVSFRASLGQMIPEEMTVALVKYAIISICVALYGKNKLQIAILTTVATILLSAAPLAYYLITEPKFQPAPISLVWTLIRHAVTNAIALIPIIVGWKQTE